MNDMNVHMETRYRYIDILPPEQSCGLPARPRSILRRREGPTRARPAHKRKMLGGIDDAARGKCGLLIMQEDIEERRCGAPLKAGGRGGL